jgi:outer membrane receptor protein involved in Fe transport
MKSKNMRLLLITTFTFIAFLSNAQYSISAKVVDSSDRADVALAGVTLTSTTDSKKQYSGFTTVDGDLQLAEVLPGKYALQVTSIGYEILKKEVVVKNKDLNLGALLMTVSSIMTDEVEVKAKQVRVQMKGDTTQFNADAYRVNPDATAEDLIRKMPGVEVVNGTVKAQGENVKRVLIDGKEFFGNDPSLALKNLPAEVIQKIEVFDRQSDQSQFSGFDDGNTEKTLNIVTRSGKSNGEFGKVYAGYGLEDQYLAGGSMNYFKGDTRLSIIGLSNNVNQQNFASDGQGGITSTNALGLNYIDKWGEKVEISASYFFNQMSNVSVDTLERVTFIDETNRQFYNESGNGSNTNYNHRISSRIEYNINKRNAIIFTPNISFQSNQKSDFFTGQTDLSTGEMLNTIFSNQRSTGSSYNLRANLTYRYRFEKRGRTFSVGVGANTKTSTGEGELLSENETFSPRPRFTEIDQINESEVVNDAYSVRVDYSEPLGENSQLRFGYEGKFNINESDQKTFDKDVESSVYGSLNPILSNSFLNDYNTNAGSVSYRYSQRRKLTLSVSLDLQQAYLNSNQTFPNELKISRTFTNLLPSAFFRYQISPTKNLRAFYRSSTNAPSITQLQNVVNNSNPLQLRAGNPDLDQEFSQFFTTRYNSINTEKATSFFAYLTAGLTNNNISNGVFTATKDTLFRGVPLVRGSQLTLPINYGTAWNIRSFTTYGFPLAFIKSNINFNFGVDYSQTPTLLNGNENISDNFGLKTGLVVGSNISQYVDFTVSYNGGYNIINNSLTPQLNNNYYSQNVGLKLNLLSPKGFFFNTEGINTLYSGLNDFDQNFTLLNVSVGQKFLKSQQGELKFTAFDILNQNTNVNRLVTEAYIEDSRSLVLNRYFMMSFTYNIRNFR